MIALFLISLSLKYGIIAEKPPLEQFQGLSKILHSTQKPNNYTLGL
jgi:hypothetical protein